MSDRHETRIRRIIGLGTLFFSPLAIAADPPAKTLQIPQNVWRVPKNNDYGNDASEYSRSRMIESDNFAFFWSKEFGADPAHDPAPDKRLPLNDMVRECERFYRCYVDELKFVKRGASVADRSKILVYIFGGSEGTAFGGAEGKIGMLWTPRSRTTTMPFGALAHELGHSFQALAQADGAWGFATAPRGSRDRPILEMTSQFMLWQVYPEWMTFENYHLNDFMKKTHYAFLHEINQYHSPYVLEYWATKHGRDFIGRMWNEAKPGEDPVLAYQRMTGIGQAEFNDEMFDAARRFVTWDLPRIEKAAARYANQHECKLDPLADGWFRIAESRCPQDYGYNGIKLEVPPPGTRVKLDFKGIAGARGFRAIRTGDAGWRYGFLAVKKDGSRVYGDTFRESEGTATFETPQDTAFLWLVVSGAPRKHSIHISDGDESNDEQWPYQFHLVGTSPDPSNFK